MTRRFLEDTQSIPNDLKSTGPRVIAAGKWRCATSSLQLAFEQILHPPLAPSMHGAYLMPHPEKLAMLNIASLEPDREKRQAVLRQIYSGYNASSDWPGFAFLPDLLEMYPDCKVVLNRRRDAEEWSTSVRTSLQFFSTFRYYILTYWLPMCNHHYNLYKTFQKLARQRYHVEDIFSPACYDAHNDWVRAVCAAHHKKLLEWEPTDGWAPLCKFLERDVPDVAFPRMNEGEEIARLTVILIKQGLWAWAKVVCTSAIVLGTGWFGWRQTWQQS